MLSAGQTKHFPASMDSKIKVEAGTYSSSAYEDQFFLKMLLFSFEFSRLK